MPNSRTTESRSNEPTFEASLAELQELVQVLEEGALGLDESIARFERGISLLRRCYQALERAEQKIELLTGFDSSGSPVTAPFASESTLDASQAAAGKRTRSAAVKKSEPREANLDPSWQAEEDSGKPTERENQLF